MSPVPFLAWRAVILAATCAVACPGIAFAQDEAFRRGLDARGDRNWKAVAVQMRSAIQADPMESTRKVAGVVGRVFRQGTEYLPHYFLGEALFNLQDCAGAVAAWGVSEQHGAVRERREFVATIASGYEQCAARGVLPPAEYNAMLLAVTQAVTEATAFAERLSKLGQANIAAWRPEVADQYAKAGVELQAAQSRLAVARTARSAADFGEARAASTRATVVLRGVETSLNASIDNFTAVTRQSREVEQLIDGAENGDRAIDALRIALPPPLAAARQNGRDLLALARERVRVAQKTENAALLTDAARTAHEASAAFTDVLAQMRKLTRAVVEREVAESAAAGLETLSFLDASFATLERLAAEKGVVAPPDTAARRAALEKRVSTIRRRFETARKTENVNGIRDATRLAAEARGELDALITSFGPVTLRDRGVHAALEDGARLFFAGEHRQALTALDVAALADAPLQVHVHLLRAAAFYHLFVRSGETDAALRTSALAEIDACKRIAPDFTPDARAFAPRFLMFFRDAGRGHAMMLTLEIVGPGAATLGAAARKVFTVEGGTIGRLPDNDWVLPDPYVSSHHACIRYHDGTFSVEDTSTNGVFLNSQDHRLVPRQPHALASGDCLWIEPYEIRASIATGAAEPRHGHLDPFLADVPPPRPPLPVAFAAEMDAGVVDPMSLLGFAPASQPAGHVPRAADLASNSVLVDHYQAPGSVMPRPPTAPADDVAIPADYDPLRADSRLFRRTPPAPPHGAGAAPATAPPAAAPPRATPPASRRLPPQVGNDDVRLDAVLAGAGIEGVAATPELARSFGRILRVVVSGVMDVLQARQRIKEEFRMRTTTFKAKENNPLKFSANVDDALHNLLVKRNAAFFEPVQAFEDAFDDVRNHQMAMLAGVRAAFETMLAEFEPDRLQQEFDRQPRKGALLSMPAKLRYWDMYREKVDGIVKDADASFRQLFGDEFARAYEAQLEQLKSRRRDDPT